MITHRESEIVNRSHAVTIPANSGERSAEFAEAGKQPRMQLKIQGSRLKRPGRAGPHKIKVSTKIEQLKSLIRCEANNFSQTYNSESNRSTSSCKTSVTNTQCIVSIVTVLASTKYRHDYCS